MLILAFDSTAKVASVAALEDDKCVSHFFVDNGLTQSELLLPMAEDTLKKLNKSFSDVDIYTCSVGPGSFTGVRIGVSVVKGLAFGTGTPTVAVSTLEGLAEGASALEGLIVPVMDARRGQYYTAIFKDGERLTPDEALSIEELAVKIRENDTADGVYLVGDGYKSAREKLLALGIPVKVTPEALIPQSAVSIGKVAYRKYLKGEVTSDKELSPTYLRLPQAERERLEKLNQ